MIDVWKKGITGQGVVVAVVDEGFDPSHPEIQANYVSCIFNYGLNKICLYSQSSHQAGALWDSRKKN